MSLLHVESGRLIEDFPALAIAAYRLSINEYMGVESPQLMIEYLE